MQINLETATPWPEINTILKQARGLEIVADGKSYTGDAELSRDDVSGVVTLTVGKAKKKAKK